MSEYPDGWEPADIDELGQSRPFMRKRSVRDCAWLAGMCETKMRFKGKLGVYWTGISPGTRAYLKHMLDWKTKSNSKTLTCTNQTSRLILFAILEQFARDPEFVRECYKANQSLIKLTGVHCELEVVDVPFKKRVFEKK